MQVPWLLACSFSLANLTHHASVGVTRHLSANTCVQGQIQNPKLTPRHAYPAKAQPSSELERKMKRNLQVRHSSLCTTACKSIKFPQAGWSARHDGAAHEFVTKSSI